MIFFYFKLFFRHFKRFRIYHLVNMLGLSIGLAAVILIGSWIQFHLSFDTFYPNHTQLFRVIQQLKEDDQTAWVAPTPTPLADALKNTVPGIINACRVHYGSDLIVKGNGRMAIEKKVIYTDSSFFNMFNPDFIYFDATALHFKHYVMLSETTAHKYFGNEPAMGKTLDLANQQEAMVAGVFRDLPRNSHFDYEMILPLSLAIEFGHEIFPDEWHPFDEIYTYVEINEEVDPHWINQQISGIKSNYDQESKDILALQPVTNIHTRSDLKYDLAITLDMNMIYIFSAIATLLLVIAIFNYIIFTIALSSSRFKEISIRKINGATRKNLIAGQLFSALLLTFFSIVLGLILIEIFSPHLQRFLHYPVAGLLLKPPLPLFLGSLLLSITFLIGIYPGIQLIRISPLSLLKPVMTSDFSRNVLLRNLVIIQFAVSLCLLIFASGIREQLNFIRNKDVGFVKEQLISIQLYDPSIEILWDHMDAFLKEMKDLPEVQEATFACSSPAMVNTSAGEVDWEGREAGQSLQVQWNSVFYNYFRTIGVDILKGSDFSADYSYQLASEQSAVFILNEAAVREMGLPAEELINREFELYGKKGPVIGIVKDFHFKSLRETIQPMAFFMHPYFFNVIILRVNPDRTGTLSSIRKVYQQYLPDIPFEYSFVQDEYETIYQGEKDLFIFNSGFALLILLISTLGLSSLAMLLVHKKTKEIGIRKINGASAREIFRLFLAYFGKWILVAMLIAIPSSAWLISLWLENFAYKSPISIQFFLYPALFLILISLLSVLVQVIKASRINPVEALRYE